MRIALVSHTSQLGGAERMLLNLACLFYSDPDICVVLIHPILDDLQANAEVYLPAACDKEHILHYAVSSTSNYIFMHKKNRNQFAHENKQYQNELIEAYKALGVDAVLVNTLTSAAPIMAAHALGLPVAVWVHGILDAYLIDRQYDASLRLLIDRLLITLCDATVCCSEWTARYYEAVTQKRLSVIPNWTAAPGEFVPIEANTGSFICLTTLDRQKGVYVLLNAALQLKEQNYHFTLRIYGDGVEQKNILTFIHEHHLDGTVSLLPRIRDVSAIYNSAFCVIQPSFIESFGMTVLEGMAHGRPVIATASGGPDELIEDGKTGFLVPRGDSTAMANKMKYLLDHINEAREMGLRGQAHYQETYSPSQAKERFHGLFEQLYRVGETEVAEKPLINDTLYYIFRTEDTLPYRLRTVISQRKKVLLCALSKVRRRLDKI